MSILRYPVDLIFALCQQEKFRIYCELFADPLLLPCATRQQASQDTVDRYTERPEHYALQSSPGWFSFLDFWQSSDTNDKEQRVLNDPRFTAEVELTIPFHDVDMMDAVWHGNYFRYFEIAHEALSNQLDYGYRQMKESDYLWPVVDTRVKYRNALTFEQRIHVRAQVKEYENCLRISYEIFDTGAGKRATIGYTIQVAVDEKSRELCFVSPDVLFERMGVTP